MFPERFSNLPEYAFPRLRSLLDAHPAGGDAVHMTIGEPQHDFPAWVTDEIAKHAGGFRKYPQNEGLPELNGAMCDWIKKRFGVTLDPDRNIMALNGTREGLYNSMMALCPEIKAGLKPIILLPNPFYQCYMVAALSVGAEPMFLPTSAETGFLPDFDSLPVETLNRVAVAYMCSPSNPQGAVADAQYWQNLMALAEKHDFKIFADECYSEIYRDTPPTGALEVMAQSGTDPERIVVFNSLSKRSNLAGLRCGFVAAGPECIKRIRLLRSYAGSPLPNPLQQAATRVWQDEAHVEDNRRLYQEKFDLADDILGDVPGYRPPQAGFFLWLPVDDGEQAALKLWTETGVRVLPGAYLSQDAAGGNPGKTYIRAALVAPKEEVAHGLKRLRDCLYT